MNQRILSFAFAAFAVSVPQLVQAQGFGEGDLYLASQSIPKGPGFGQQGLLRIDPFTGSATLVRTFQAVERSFVYEPTRDRLAVNCTINNTSGLHFIDSLGNPNYAGLDNLQAYRVAARGDGRLYCLDVVTRKIHVLDALGGVSDLLDSTGAAPFVLGGNSFSPTRDDLHYDAATNSLFFVGWTLATDAGFASGVVPRLIKIPLSSGGNQVSGSTTSVAIGLQVQDPLSTVDYAADSLSAGPGGSLMLTLDDNTNAQFARMVVIDPATLQYAPYALNGPYTGAASTMAGTYSHALGRALILDSFTNVLRAFSLGQTGLGVEFGAEGSVSSDIGSGETAKLIEIRAGASVAGLAVYGTGTPGCAGQHGIGATKAPHANIPGFRITTTLASPSSLGLLLVGNAPDVAGSDPFAIDILLHIDMLNTTQLLSLDIVSNGFGFAETPYDIPLSPAIVGSTFDAQSIWVWSGCSPTKFGLSSSPGLAMTILP